MLGGLGIDPITIVAQVVDFLILVYFLNKFLYKPVVGEIEKNEKDLQKAKDEKLQIEQERDQLKIEKANSQEKSRKILEEAEMLAEKIKKDAESEAEQKALNIIYQVRRQMEEKETEIRREMRKEEQQRVNGKR